MSAATKRQHDKWWSFFLQNGRCILCGGALCIEADPHTYGGPTFEHKVPVSHGGAAWRQNRALSHHECNGARGGRSTLKLLRPEQHPGKVVDERGRRRLVPMCGIWYSHFRMPPEDPRWEHYAPDRATAP
jgi:hypothetical protein